MNWRNPVNPRDDAALHPSPRAARGSRPKKFSCSLCLISALISLLGSCNFALANSATDDILKVVPAQAGVCLIVEDLAAHYQSVARSELWKRIQASHPYQRWLASPTYGKLTQVWPLLPIYLGMSGAELRDEVLGQSVVLAFRPRQNAEDRDIGIFFCRAADEQLLTKLVTALSVPTNQRKVEKRHHRDTLYYWRQEGRKAPEYLLQLGPIGVLTDSETAIQQVIDAYMDGGGLAESPLIHRVRNSLPEGTPLQILVNPRSLDASLSAMMKPKNPGEEVIQRYLQNLWKSLDWLAVTLGIGDAVQLSLHWQPKEESAPSVPPENRFWQRLPADVLAAGIVNLDLVSTIDFLSHITDQRTRTDMRVMGSVVQQLLAGYSLDKDILPLLGPLWGFAAYLENADLRLITMLQLRDVDANKSDELTIDPEVALEFALRPVLVLIGLEQNREKNDQIQAQMLIAQGARIHYLYGSTIWPSWAQPSFAVSSGFVMLASHPSAITHWLRDTSSSLKDEIERRFPTATDSVHLYVNLHQLAQLVDTRRQQLAAKWSESTEQQQILQQHLQRVAGLLRLFDKMFFSTSRTEHVHRAAVTLTVEP